MLGPSLTLFDYMQILYDLGSENDNLARIQVCLLWTLQRTSPDAMFETEFWAVQVLRLLQRAKVGAILSDPTLALLQYTMPLINFLLRLNLQNNSDDSDASRISVLTEIEQAEIRFAEWKASTPQFSYPSVKRRVCIWTIWHWRWNTHG